MKIIAFGASSSSKSINKQLAAYTASLVTLHHSDAEIEVLDLNDFELPLFSSDKELTLGQPNAAKIFFNKLGESDAIIISFAEHNGNFTAAYKNIFDWASRINKKVFQNKPVLLLSTSPGSGGAVNVLAIANNTTPHFAGIVKASVSVPNFFDNYDSETKTIINAEIQQKLAVAVENLLM